MPLRDQYVPTPPKYNKVVLITAIVIVLLVNVAYAFMSLIAGAGVYFGVKVLERLFCIIPAVLLAIAMIVTLSVISKNHKKKQKVASKNMELSKEIKNLPIKTRKSLLFTSLISGITMYLFPKLLN